MKSARWLRCAAAAGCMMFALAMPAWADEWNTVNGDITISYQGGEQIVSQVGGVTKADAAPVITSQTLDGTGFDVWGKHLYLDGTNGTVQATLKKAYLRNNWGDSAEPLAMDGDVVLTLDDQSYWTGNHIERKNDAQKLNLTLKGTGSLYCYFDAGMSVDSLKLESVTMDMNGEIKTGTLTVASGATLSAQKATKDQTHWIADKAGNEFVLDENQIQGKVVYKDEDGNEVKKFPATKYDIWVKMTGGFDQEVETELDSNISKIEDSYSFLKYDLGEKVLEGGFLYDRNVEIKVGKKAGKVDVNFVGNESFGDSNQIGKIKVDGAQNVTVSGYTTNAEINCSGTLELQNKARDENGAVIEKLSFTQSEGKNCLLWNVDSAEEATPKNAQKIGPNYTLAGENAKKYIKIMPVDDAAGGDDADDTPVITAPANDGSAVVGIALGTAAVWGGYEAATRIILNKLLPEGAAIPKTQAQLAVLLWNTAGQPEPASAPAFADVDAATAKAAQWCTEQGYLTGSFKPEKRVAKFNVIRTWNKAFPKN